MSIKGRKVSFELFHPTQAFRALPIVAQKKGKKKCCKKYKKGKRCGSCPKA